MSIATSLVLPNSITSPTGPLDEENDFEREIALVQAHRRNLIARRNALFSPIACLPAATVANIFHFVEIPYTPQWIDDQFDDDVWTDTSRMPDPRCLIPIMLVSSAWRDIAVNHPSLWGFVDTQFWSPHGMRLLAERSKGDPLTCCIQEHRLPPASPPVYVDGHTGVSVPYPPSSWPSGNWDNEELQYFLGLSSRMRRLELSLKVATFQRIHDQMPVAWAELLYASFAITGRPRKHETPFLPNFPVKTAKKLRFLALRGFRLNVGGKYHFPALRSFSLKRGEYNIFRISLGDILPFLNATPLLENLELHASKRELAAETDSVALVSVALPKLQRLSFQIYLNGTSSLAALLSHLSLPTSCSTRVSLSSQQSPRGEPTEITTESELQDMAECLLSSLSSYKSLFTPSHLTLVNNDLGTSLILTADDMPSATPLKSWRMEAFVPCRYPSQAVENRPNEELEHQTRCLEILLPHACSLSSLTTLDCAIQISTSLWLSTFGDLATLRHVRLYCETATWLFVDALGLRPENPERQPRFQALQHIEIDCLRSISAPYHPTGFEFDWGTPTPGPVDLFSLPWVRVLGNLTDVLQERRERDITLMQLTIHREVSGCSLGPDTLTELRLLAEISELVTDVVLMPPKTSAFHVGT